MSRLEELKRLIDKYEFDTKRLIELYNEAIIIADKENILKERISLRWKAVQEYQSTTKAMTTLKLASELRSIMDEHKMELDNNDILMILDAYNAACRQAYHYYQIPMPKVLELQEDFKKIVIENSLSLVEYYDMKISHSMYFDDKEKVEYYFDKILEIDDNGLNVGCDECYESFKLDSYLYLDRENECKDFIGKYYNNMLTCKDAAKNMESIMMTHYAGKGDLDKLKDIIPMAYRSMREDVFFIGNLDIVILYYAHEDIERALNVLEINIDKYLVNDSPYVNLRAAMALWILFEKVKLERDKTKVELNFPKELSIYSEGGIYSIDEIIEFFKERSLDLYFKFNERNGGEYGYGIPKFFCKLLLGKSFDEMYS